VISIDSLLQLRHRHERSRITPIGYRGCQHQVIPGGDQVPGDAGPSRRGAGSLTLTCTPSATLNSWGRGMPQIRAAVRCENAWPGAIRVM
jgi:hypothetical protein